MRPYSFFGSYDCLLELIACATMSKVKTQVRTRARMRAVSRLILPGRMKEITAWRVCLEQMAFEELLIAI